MKEKDRNNVEILYGNYDWSDAIKYIFNSELHNIKTYNHCYPMLFTTITLVSLERDILSCS